MDQTKTLFNRAAFHAFGKGKLLATFCILALCGMLTVFSRGVGVGASAWVQMSLTFLPILLSGGILMGAGILMVRLYHDELKNRDKGIWETVKGAWDLIIGAMYLSVPLMLIYLVLWVVLGVFVLLGEIPVIGESLAALLAFAPFLLNLASLLLCVATIALLFYAAPAAALTGGGHREMAQGLLIRLKTDPYTNLHQLIVALLPLIAVVGLLTIAARLTGSVFVMPEGSAVHVVLQWFFVMLPYTGLMTPAVVFFFNFAAEAHVQMRAVVARGGVG